MYRNNNVVKNVKTNGLSKMKAERIDREEKTAKLEARKQASRVKSWSKYDHERY